MTIDTAIAKDRGEGITRLEWRDIRRRVLMIDGKQHLVDNNALSSATLSDADRAAKDWIPIR
jgi:hypothetical protein